MEQLLVIQSIVSAQTNDLIWVFYSKPLKGEGGLIRCLSKKPCSLQKEYKREKLKKKFICKSHLPKLISVMIKINYFWKIIVSLITTL